jgi:hypothetical protein
MPSYSLREFVIDSFGDQNDDVVGLKALISDAPFPTPLPGALPLFATCLGVLGLIGWRRKKKATAPAA